MRSDIFAGVERYVANVCSTLAHRGHHVVILASNPAPMRAALAGPNIELASGAGTLGLAAAIRRHARDADIVHAHMTAAEVAAVLASVFVRAPVVATRHFPLRRGSSVLGRLVAPVVKRRVAAELAISRFVAHAVPEDTEVVLNGVADEEPVDPVDPVVLVAQRLEPEKRTADAIEAWAASALATRGWELWIAGDGSERASLEAMVDRSSVAGVRFLGYRDDVPELRRGVSVLLATAPAEPFGLSVAEAMAAGLPVVATSAGGHRETVGPVRPDLLYPPGDTQACARVLTRVAADVTLRRDAGRELRDFQQQALGLDRHVDDLLACYQRVLAPASEHVPKLA